MIKLETKPIAVCCAGHLQFAPIDTTKRRCDVPVCYCGALIFSYFGPAGAAR